MKKIYTDAIIDVALANNPNFVICPFIILSPKMTSKLIYLKITPIESLLAS